MQLMPRRDLEGQRLARNTVKLFGAVAISSSICFTQALAADVSELPRQLQEKVKLAAEACAKFDNGEFSLEWGAVERIDLDGDLYSDWVLNEYYFACSAAVFLYCGTGGCMSHFLVKNVRHSLLNKGWQVVDFGSNLVVLAAVHGSQCSGINPTRCVTASTWDDEEMIWRSTDAKWQ